MRRNRYATEIGRRVTKLIAEACTTQSALAERLGLSRTALNQMLTGRRPAWGDLEEKVRGILQRW